MGSTLAEQLELMALWLEQHGFSAWGPWPQIRLVMRVDGCLATVKSIAHPDYLRARAARLRRKVPEGTQHTRLPRPHSPRRPSFSQAVYEAFIRDGENENAQNYKDLYGV